LGPARIALLLVLLAAGLGLLALTAIPGGPLAVTQKEESPSRAAGDFLAREQVASPSRSLQEILAHPDIIPSHHHPLLGQPAPDFELADSEGKVWNLRELQDGHPVVLIFYYGCHCVGCVRQLFDINRELPLYSEVGARVVAISADPPELTRERFQQNGPFGFPVLSDPGNKVAQAYRVFKHDNLRHGIFVVDRNGTVQWVNVGDAPLRRNPALLYQLAKMAGGEW
jgi:peroxiredoxin